MLRTAERRCQVKKANDWNFGDVPIAPRYQVRFIRPDQSSELFNLWHLSRTATSGAPDYGSRHARMLWTSAVFSKAHPEVSSTAAYKDLEGLITPRNTLK